MEQNGRIFHRSTNLLIEKKNLLFDAVWPSPFDRENLRVKETKQSV